MALDFPPPLSDEQLYKEIAVLPPKRPEAFKSFTVNVRLEWVADMEGIHLPFDVDLDVLRLVIRVVRYSFIPRNPNDPRVMQFIVRASRGHEGVVPRLSRAGGGGGIGILVTGVTGMGKTSLVDRIEQCLDGRARLHLALDGKPCRWIQLGVVRVTVQSTWKATLEAILLVIDAKIGRDSLVRRERDASRPKLFKAVFQALSSGFTALLILDEFQRLKRLSQGTAEEILNGIVDLMEGAGIPIMVVGTVLVRSLFESFPSQMSKFLNSGDQRFNVMKRGSKEWNMFIDTLKEYHVSLTPIVYAATFNDDLYLQTMGVRRIVREVMKALFKRHAENESLIADRGLLDDIARNELASYQMALGALRTHALNFTVDFHTYQAYEDYLPQEQERPQSSAVKLIEAKWRHETRISPGHSTPPLSISEYLQLEAAVRSASSDSASTSSTRSTEKKSGLPASTPTEAPKAAASATEQNSDASSRSIVDGPVHTATAASPSAAAAKQSTSRRKGKRKGQIDGAQTEPPSWIDPLKLG